MLDDPLVVIDEEPADVGEPPRSALLLEELHGTRERVGGGATERTLAFERGAVRTQIRRARQPPGDAVRPRVEHVAVIGKVGHPSVALPRLPLPSPRSELGTSHSDTSARETFVQQPRGRQGKRLESSKTSLRGAGADVAP